jgi:hypothetical protein
MVTVVIVIVMDAIVVTVVNVIVNYGKDLFS